MSAFLPQFFLVENSSEPSTVFMNKMCSSLFLLHSLWFLGRVVTSDNQELKVRVVSS